MSRIATTKIKKILLGKSLGSMLAHVSLVCFLIFLLGVIYFYIYLPATTNHGETITVPDLTGMQVKELEDFLPKHDLRYIVDDSAYSEKFQPLTVLRQFPRAGSKVKEGRVLYLSINRITPPTMPVPDLVDHSLVNAEAVLKSSELRRGRILYESSPFPNLVKEMRYKGNVIPPGTRIPKGAVIDLVVGDGRGSADFTVGSLVGDTYDRALFKLMGWNLHLGKIRIPDDGDTTGHDPYVFKQYPAAGDSVRVGDPVDLWIAPKGYKPASDAIDSEIN
jgi:eukaryotic-like serine/threonine-protein kinase